MRIRFRVEAAADVEAAGHGTTSSEPGLGTSSSGHWSARSNSSWRSLTPFPRFPLVIAGHSYVGSPTLCTTVLRGT